MKGCPEVMLGKKIVRHSPAVLSAMPAPRAMPMQPKGLSLAVPRSAPSPTRTKFRPSVAKLPTQTIGQPVRG